jgi:large repetitive protein
VYDAITRAPVANPNVALCPTTGAAAISLVGQASYTPVTIDGQACFERQFTGSTGYYYFFLFSPSGEYTLHYRGNGGGYLPSKGLRGASSILAAQASGNNIIGGSNDSVAGDNLVQVQAQGSAPTVNQITNYHMGFTINSGPAFGDIIYNHIPVDPAALPSLTIQKTADKSSAELGDSIRYTLIVKRMDSGAYGLASLKILDTLPAGFTYIPGTMQVNGKAITDAQAGLSGRGPVLPIGLSLTLAPISLTDGLKGSGANEVRVTYRVRLGVGSMEGTGINRARASVLGTVCVNSSTPGCSNEAQFKVKVTGGVFAREGCVIGKVYMDCNGNRMQEPTEQGVPDIRLYMENGTSITTDAEGKYSICGISPMTHVLKVDAKTLPANAKLALSSNRNVGDADSLFVDVKAGDTHRADFTLTCTAPVLEQVKMRRQKHSALQPPLTEPPSPPLQPVQATAAAAKAASSSQSVAQSR